MMKKPIYVVTKSIGRKWIFQSLGIKVNFYSIDVPESKFEDPVETVLMNSILKCREARRHLDGVIITFDTVVAVDNEILGKPKDMEEAISMLKLLSGKSHNVFTGMAIYIDGEIKTDYGEARVWFKELSEEEIRWHVENEEYWKFAGGYRIQGLASLFIEKIEGDFYSVVGVPLNKLYRILMKHGINLIEYMEMET